VKYVLYGAIVIFGLKYGFAYLGSEDFQRYADESKAPWTCRVNIIMGKFNMMLSRHDKAILWFNPVLTRCPKTSMTEEAMFQIAVNLEQMGRRAEAIEAYKKYAEVYKGSKRSRLALKAADILS